MATLLIIHLSFLRIGQEFIGTLYHRKILINLGKFLFGIGTGVLIGVKFLGQLIIGFLDLFGVSGFANPENLLIIDTNTVGIAFGFGGGAVEEIFGQ